MLTLHVGPGTFQPVRAAEIENHRMEGERYSLSAASAEKINRTKLTGKRVVAVGSTSTRTLEWIALQKGELVADEGIARLYLRPGDKFRVLDALITNFHLPGSTPLILVAAFAGLDLVRRAYREAIARQYRFYSYGDAMLDLMNFGFSSAGPLLDFGLWDSDSISSSYSAILSIRNPQSKIQNRVRRAIFHTHQE